jgi:hypothetical protein
MRDAIAATSEDAEREAQERGRDESTRAQNCGIDRAPHHERCDWLLEPERRPRSRRIARPSHSAYGLQRTIEPGSSTFGAGAPIAAGPKRVK